MFKILAAVECVNSGRYLAKSQDILIFQKHPQMSQFRFLQLQLTSAAITLELPPGDGSSGVPNFHLVSIFTNFGFSWNCQNTKKLKKCARHRPLASSCRLCPAVVLTLCLAKLVYQTLRMIRLVMIILSPGLLLKWNKFSVTQWSFFQSCRYFNHILKYNLVIPKNTVRWQNFSLI